MEEPGKIIHVYKFPYIFLLEQRRIILNVIWCAESESSIYLSKLVLVFRVLFCGIIMREEIGQVVLIISQERKTSPLWCFGTHRVFTCHLFTSNLAVLRTEERMKINKIKRTKIWRKSKDYTNASSKRFQLLTNHVERWWFWYFIN